MKTLLLDADGVVLAKGEYFSERFARDYNIPAVEVIEFFKGPFVECQKGEADLKEELVPYLAKWNWDKGTEAFLDYWFDSDVVLNPRIKEIISKFKDKGVSCYLASNNEKYRADVIDKMLKEENLLDGTYFSGYMKVRKENPEFFKFILNDLGITPDKTYFIDNDQKNVDSALSVGIQAVLYSEDELNSLLAKI